MSAVGPLNLALRYLNLSPAYSFFFVVLWLFFLSICKIYRQISKISTYLLILKLVISFFVLYKMQRVCSKGGMETSLAGLQAGWIWPDGTFD
jgi:hypothetical protein